MISITKKTILNVRYNIQYRRYEVESETHEGHKYSVCYSDYYEAYICSCPWGRGMAQQKKRDCKHVWAVKEFLAAQKIDLKEFGQCPTIT